MKYLYSGDMLWGEANEASMAGDYVRKTRRVTNKMSKNSGKIHETNIPYCGWMDARQATGQF
jgi:hypothetical protein